MEDRERLLLDREHRLDEETKKNRLPADKPASKAAPILVEGASAPQRSATLTIAGLTESLLNNHIFTNVITAANFPVEHRPFDLGLKPNDLVALPTFEWPKSD